MLELELQRSASIVRQKQALVQVISEGAHIWLDAQRASDLESWPPRFACKAPFSATFDTTSHQINSRMEHGATGVTTAASARIDNSIGGSTNSRIPSIGTNRPGESCNEDWHGDLNTSSAGHCGASSAPVSGYPLSGYTGNPGEGGGSCASDFSSGFTGGFTGGFAGGFAGTFAGEGGPGSDCSGGYPGYPGHAATGSAPAVPVQPAARQPHILPSGRDLGGWASPRADPGIFGEPNFGGVRDGSQSHRHGGSRYLDPTETAGDRYFPVPNSVSPTLARREGRDVSENQQSEHLPGGGRSDGADKHDWEHEHQHIHPDRRGILGDRLNRRQ